MFICSGLRFIVGRPRTHVISGLDCGDTISAMGDCEPAQNSSRQVQLLSAPAGSPLNLRRSPRAACPRRRRHLRSWSLLSTECGGRRDTAGLQPSGASSLHGRRWRWLEAKQRAQQLPGPSPSPPPEEGARPGGGTGPPQFVLCWPKVWAGCTINGCRYGPGIAFAQA